ncbi:hypothetical protein [Pedobacter sandarakinus]|uniref:hypothetical protein n=1 Tax=Pedobacter sandarakinus TaxID=353156 RepID=UPI002247656C|nr:hypothetical protein [Pedobacter sandarakinus]MCX2573225.1 hypothetical protein [Pedobacter sandarakinus]
MGALLNVLLPSLIGAISAILVIFINQYFETRNKQLASKKKELEKIFAPLEILSRVNKQEFIRFQAMGKITDDERNFIEQSIWYPNNMEIKKILMSNSHLLSEMPQAFLDLLDHINLWLFVYESKYVSKTYNGPVYAGPGGKPYPKGADEYIYQKASEYRALLRK